VNWKGKRVLITGGTSFIGSSLVDALVSRGAIVRVVDDLSTGLVESGTVEFIKGDLLEAGEPRVPFGDGIVKTIDWYVKNRNPDEVRSQLQSMLTER
jgi:NAD(P)-dependent dehydrogenase (short-subunit alcohol dehydrogenase family)